VRGKGLLRHHVVSRFGLAQHCERDVLVIPVPGDNPEIVYSDYECRPFPMSVRDHCEKGNRAFCVSWATASYIDEVCLRLLFFSDVYELVGVGWNRVQCSRSLGNCIWC
jgi:hypothetical protein